MLGIKRAGCLLLITGTALALAPGAMAVTHTIGVDNGPSEANGITRIIIDDIFPPATTYNVLVQIGAFSTDPNTAAAIADSLRSALPSDQYKIYQNTDVTVTVTGPIVSFALTDSVPGQDVTEVVMIGHSAPGLRLPVVVALAVVMIAAGALYLRRRGIVRV